MMSVAAQDEIQKLTDKAVADIDQLLAVQGKGNPAGLKRPGASTADVQLMTLPRHIAIIMDGNGRWAS